MESTVVYVLLPVKVDEPEGVGVVNAAPEIVVTKCDDLGVIVVKTEVIVEILPRLILAMLRLMPSSATVALLILFSKAIVPEDNHKFHNRHIHIVHIICIFLEHLTHLFLFSSSFSVS